MSTIVTGYVPTPEGRAALTRAISEAKLRRAELLVLNTSHGDRYVDPRFAGPDDLEAVREQLEASGVTYELRQSVRGLDAAEEIVQAASAAGVELVVIGMRHRTPVGKLLLGSSSQAVLLRAPCDVLAVKA